MPSASKSSAAAAALPQPRVDYDLALLAPVFFGLSIVLQVMMTLLIMYGPNLAARPEDLLEQGRRVCLPERDIPIFVLCSVLAIAACIGSVVHWKDVVQSVGEAQRPGLMKSSSATLALLGAGSFVLYIVMFTWRFVANPDADPHTPGLRLHTPVGPADASTIWLPQLLAIICAWVELRDQRNRLLGIARAPAPTSRPAAWATHIILLLLIAGALFIPAGNWSALAGRFFLADWMHHWNFFSMGPALKYSYGRAFHVDFYSQYGMGWPMIAVFLSRWLPISYTNLLGEGIAGGVIYYAGFYLLLVLLFRKVSWAAIGVLLALSWQIYVDTNGDAWQFPSSTFMRAPFDVFCFACLLMHRRSDKLFWILLAGAFGGLELLFEVDTGVYLAVTLIFYGIVCLIQPPTGSTKDQTFRRRWIMNGMMLAGFFATLLPGLLLASRGELFHGIFWSRWLEGVYNQEIAGISLIPIGALETNSLLFFTVQVAAYLITSTYMLVRIFRRTATGHGVLLGCVAIYGMGCILIFVGRSHPLNLLHPTIPFVIVLVNVLVVGHDFLRDRLGARLATIAPALAMALGIFIVTGNEFLSYPGVLQQALYRRTPDTGHTVTVFPKRGDLVGVPVNISVADDNAGALLARETDAVSLAASNIAPHHHDLAILDPLDTMLYYGANVEPWGRYPSLWRGIYTQNTLQATERELLKDHPRFVLIRGDKNTPMLQNFTDIWDGLYPTVRSHYRLIGSIATFELYEYEENKKPETSVTSTAP